MSTVSLSSQAQARNRRIAHGAKDLACLLIELSGHGAAVHCCFVGVGDHERPVIHLGVNRYTRRLQREGRASVVEEKQLPGKRAIWFRATLSGCDVEWREEQPV